MARKRPKVYLLYGQYFSLDDTCMRCGETLGEHGGHGGSKYAPCPPYNPTSWAPGKQHIGPQFTLLIPALVLPYGT